MLLSPVFLLIALAIRLDSTGPVFFRQARIGRGGVPFRIIKFRSMTPDAPEKGPQITSAGDPRVTRVGRILRRTKLDEFPQLINVLKGEMSFVGPRPEVPSYVAFYDEQQRKVLSVRPGITDPASIAYSNEEEILEGVSDVHRAYVDDIMPRKLELNLAYIDKMSFAYDLKLIFKTFSKVFVKK